MNLRRFTLACVLGFGSAAAASATNLNNDVAQFAAGVRNYNLITFGDSTFTSASDMQEGLACNGLLTVDGNTLMSGGGTNYVASSDPSFYVSGTLKLNGGYTKINSGYASTPNLTGGYTFSNKQLNTPPPGNGTLDSTNSNDARSSTNPISNPAPANWNWSTLQSTMESISSDLGNAPITGTISASSGNLVLTTNLTSGVAVFQLDMSKFNGVNYNGQKVNNVSISVPAGVNYVINVINASGQTIWPSSVNFNSGSNNGQLLWNFPGCTGQITLGGGQFFGSILAPDAYVFTTNTIPVGQVVAGSFRDNSAELHYIAFAAKSGSTPTITSASTASGNCGSPFTYTTTASGSPTGYTATGLPPGITCDPCSGALSGTPTTGGTYPVTITATNGNGSGSGTVTITIKYQLTVSASPAAGGTASGGGAYAPNTSASISATPATDYAFTSWTGAGIATPSSAATTDTVTGAQTAVANFAMIPPTITSALTANDVVGTASTSYTITATHHPTSYAASGLPAGLSLNSTTGVISGTPTKAGTYPVTISATNAGGTGSATLNITVIQTYTLTITSPGGGTYSSGGTYNAGAVVGITQSPSSGYRAGGWSGSGVGMVAYPSNSATTVTMNGNCTLVANFIAQGTLTVSANSGGSASGGGTFDLGSTPAITASPATDYAFTSWTGSGVASPGASSTTVTLSGNQTVTASFAMMAPVITSALTAADKLNEASSLYTITATHHPTSYNASGLPPGLSVNPQTGAITGVPTSAGNYNATISATNAGGTGSATLAIAVSQTYQLTIANSPAAGGTASGAGTYDPGTVVTINAVANSGYRATGWSGSGVGAVADATAASTTVTMNANTALQAQYVQQVVLTVAAGTGGAASGGGTYDLGASPAIVANPATDYAFTSWSGAGVASPGSATTSVTLASSETVTASFAMIPPVITSALTATGKRNEPSASYAIKATHNPTSFNAVGLPSGLSVNPQSGLITGTPTAAGTFNVTISATNAGGTGSAVLVITVGQTYQLTITGSPAAGGTFTAGGTYDAGSVVGIAETAASGYRTNGWSGAGISMVAYPSNSATTVTMTGDCALVANFVGQATLTVTAGAGGTAAGSGTFDAGSTPAITASPSVDYQFTGWTGPNVTDPTAQSTTVSLAASETVSASFSMMAPVITSTLSAGGKLNSGSIYYQITATHHPTSYAAAGLPPGLSVDPSTGIITGTATAAGSFSTTIAATNGGGTGSATLVFTISQTYQLTITGSPAAGGSFTGQGIYAPGTVVSITQTPGTGYRNAGWSGPGVASVYNPSASTTTVTLNSDTTLTANFVQQGTLTVAAGAGGAATGSGIFDVGSVTPIAATANSGYVFTGWTGDGITDPNAASTTVTVPGNETVTANFLAASNPEQLGTIVFPNAIASGQPGVTPTTSSNSAVVTNNGSNPETVTSLTTTGDFSAQVSLPFTLQPGQSLTIPMTFAPSAIGPRTGQLTGVSSDTNHAVFQFTLEGTGTYPNEPPSATIDAATTGYTGSPFMVSSTAFAPNNNLTLHSIEWMSPEGAWTVDVANVTGGNSSRTLGISFTETGLWTLRAGASTDNGATWYYSSSVQVAVSAGTQAYTFQSMAVPGNGQTLWYAPSPVATKTYQVQHTNPSTPGP